MNDTDPYPAILRNVGEFGFLYFRPEEAGWRASMVDFSDFAAFGSVPVRSIVSLVLPLVPPEKRDRHGPCSPATSHNTSSGVK